MHELPGVGDNKTDAKKHVQTRGPQLSVKQQMLRFLLRSKSMVRPAPPERQNRHSDTRKLQVTKNGIVVTIANGVPYVMGTDAKKGSIWTKRLGDSDLDNGTY
ncbi:hypothetical protein FQA39_LY16016 [Lamprigera yunnana]|nr:hypothetical protein FQA39_LY16016 [Lamprigera yunnana]